MKKEEKQISKTKKVKEEFIPLVALKDVVVFPYMIIPLFIGREKSLKAIEHAMKYDRNMALVLQKNIGEENPSKNKLFEYGCRAEILQILRLPDGTNKMLVEGKSRIRIEKTREKNGMYQAVVKEVDDIVEESLETEALTRSVVDLFEQYVKLNRKLPIEVMMIIMNTKEPGRLVDIIIAHMNLRIDIKQKLLESIDVTERLKEVSLLLAKEVDILTLEKKIRINVKKNVDQFQKEYYLKEQIKVIQKELGSSDDLLDEVIKFREKLSNIKNISDESREVISKEIDRLEKMHQSSSEAIVERNYLETVLELPWDKKSKDNKNLQKVENILNKDHYGLEKVKERILEFLAVKQRVDKLKGPILCLVGPPGVGKTSLGKSIARALGRKFSRISLGGVRDEAEIRGHRKTYIGAMPGKIIQELGRAKSSNPLFLLDEVDKLANDFRGDPTSALLEVLDPEQNNSFTDHYLNIPFDLSDIFFITTSNVIHTIPPALRDRMEIIRISGYLEDEKLNIARKHIIPKMMRENGLNKSHLKFNKSGILEIVQKYTKEAGVRSLEKKIGTICRKRIRDLVQNGNEEQVIINKKDVSTYLGVPIFTTTISEKKPMVGTVNGLAWTEVGGVLLIIETAMMKGKGKFNITGQIGDVMEESSRASFTYIKSKAEELKIDSEIFEKNDFHIHIPEGATPKDGPSAGITMTIALISLMTNRKVRADFAMTGEMTLRGRILPIGGVKEKVLAALSEGIINIILPIDNKKDIEDIPEQLREKMKFHFVEYIDEAIKLVII